MEKQSRGIVLFKKDKTVSIIDENHGRFFATTFGNLMVGGLYVYDIKPYAKQYTIQQEELLLLPFEILQDDIIFFHHILELCLFFIPLGSCAKEVFRLFLKFYSEPLTWSSHKNKKFLVFKILALLGIWPHPIVLKDQLLHIAEIPIDRINKEILELVSEKEIEQWILRVIKQDPLFTKMKTKIFLESIYDND